MSRSANSFSLLDEENEVPENKPYVSLFETEESKAPALNEEQKAIVQKKRDKWRAKKAEKQAKKEKDERCFFFDECGGKKDKVWAYCKKCYESKRSKCRWCDNNTRLSAVDGKFHEMCGTCRHEAQAHGLDVSDK